jgi:hypothetical protein
MKMIPPVQVTDAVLHSCNVPEADTWDAQTIYAEGDEVELAAGHRRFKSQVAGNQGNDPAQDDGTNWLEMGASNRWRAFDQKIGQSTTNPGSIRYELDIPTRVTGIALIGVYGVSVRVALVQPGTGETIHEETRVPIETSEIVAWYSYFYREPDYDDELIFTGLPGFGGNRVVIEIDAGAGVAEVGQIILGKVYPLGVPLEGGQLGIEDFSLIGRDDFGKSKITARAYANTAELHFGIPVVGGSRDRQERMLRKRLAAQRAVPTLYFSDENLIDAGTMVYGLFDDISIPLISAGMAECVLEIKGLT